METFNLESYLNKGVENIVKGMLKASLKTPKVSLFMAQYAAASKKARKIRLQAKQQGEHIPPFLIASITNQCNLHCKGCYARENNVCYDTYVGEGTAGLLTDEQWANIFDQAKQLGIGFILLAGGEPFTRPGVLREAGRRKNILFPIFTNGTMMDEAYQNLLTSNRNLVPILSIEGNKETTDGRRGPGVYEKLRETMKMLQSAEILFGASVTITKKNAEEVLSDAFTQSLAMSGCKAVIYVEYVPVDHVTEYLAPDDGTRAYIEERLNALRQKREQLYISFPGDERSSGGCLAAGRGFFHINAAGGVEPCPFSPFSDTNLRHRTLREALRSPLFAKLKEEETLLETHTGGCVLFQKESLVKELLGE